MSDFGEMAEGLKHNFARCVGQWAEGKKMQMMVRPGAVNYGSSNTWHDVVHPEYHPNFQYRILNETEKLNLMSAIHEGDTD